MKKLIIGLLAFGAMSAYATPLQYKCFGDDQIFYFLQVDIENDFGQINELIEGGNLGAGAIATGGLRVEPVRGSSDDLLVTGLIAAGDHSQILFSITIVEGADIFEVSYFNPLLSGREIPMRCFPELLN